MLSSICIFTGSSHGRLEAYSAAASEIGRFLAERQINLVFGGGHVGLMGKAARMAALELGGRSLGLFHARWLSAS